MACRRTGQAETASDVARTSAGDGSSVRRVWRMLVTEPRQFRPKAPNVLWVADLNVSADLGGMAVSRGGSRRVLPDDRGIGDGAECRVAPSRQVGNFGPTGPAKRAFRLGRSSDPARARLRC